MATPRFRALGICMALLLVGALASQSAEARERRPPPKTKKVDAVTKPVYEKLTEAHEALNAESPNTGKALRLLQELDRSDKLNNHERSLVWQTYGFLYAGQEKYPQAISAFRKCLDLGGLPDAAALNTQYNLAQLYLVSEQYDKGIAELKSWFAKAENPGPQAYMMMANAYAQKEDYREALSWAKQGLAKMDTPKEGWIRLVMQLHLQLEEYKSALPLLEQLVVGWPKRQYFLQLAAIYGETKQDQKSLVMLEAAYWQGWLEKSKDLERLCQMYLFHEVPYNCGTLAEKHLKDGSMESNPRNWEMLANAWTLSQEFDRAIAPLNRAASLSAKGELYVRLGQIHLDAERWKDAEDALRKGLDKGGVKNAGQAQLLIGISHFNRKNFESAISWFERANRGKTSREARQWIAAAKQRQDQAAATGE